MRAATGRPYGSVHIHKEAVMLNQHEIMQTIQMIDQQHLDVRTITMGISLLSCAHSDVKTSCDKVYDKITKYAENLVATGEAIEKEFGIPIVNKRISVTPIALVAAAAETETAPSPTAARTPPPAGPRWTPRTGRTWSSVCRRRSRPSTPSPPPP